MKIVIAITGGISAYKATDVISALLQLNHHVKVIATDNALNFVTPHVLNVISRNNYVTETPGQTTHIELAKWADAFVVVPATANTIAKLNYGIADNLVTETYLALHKETVKIICPAMNTHMWENETTQYNITKLKSAAHIINPVSGLLACGDYGMGKLPSTKVLVEEIDAVVTKRPVWRFPLMLSRRGITTDSYSFLDFDWHNEVEIPVESHVGAFGVRRRHDVHKGVDLYASEGTTVYAVEDGEVVDICPFTGEAAGCPWWENTQAVYVKGKSGIVIYGEILPQSYLVIGSKVSAGHSIGVVAKVLKENKGRPQSMLHLELHEHDYIHTGQWKIGQPKPQGVLNPTKYLIRVIENN